MRRDGGGAEIDRQTIDRALVIPGPDVHDPRGIFLIAQMDGDGDFPIALAQDRLHHLQDVQIGGDFLQLPLLGERSPETFQIARGFVHVGLRHLDVEEFDGRVQHDLPRLGAFAHDLFVHLALWRHVDHHIALHRGLTAQTAALFQAALFVIAFLDRVPFAQRVRRDGHPMFRELPIARRDLTFRTDAAPAADRVQIDTQLPRGGQHRGAFGKAPSLAGGRENHEGVTAHRGRPLFLCDSIACRAAGERCGAAIRAAPASFPVCGLRGGIGLSNPDHP